MVQWWVCRLLVCSLLLPPAASFVVQAQSQSSKDGISFEEDRRSFPPVPIGVRAEIRNGKATVLWDKPPAADRSEKLAYDPVIDHYCVYRVTGTQNLSLIGKTDATVTSFTDSTAHPGMTRRYVVTAVQRSGHESAPSMEAVLHLP